MTLRATKCFILRDIDLFFKQVVRNHKSGFTDRWIFSMAFQITAPGAPKPFGSKSLGF
jgi:hypothetical protein